MGLKVKTWAGFICVLAFQWRASCQLGGDNITFEVANMKYRTLETT